MPLKLAKKPSPSGVFIKSSFFCLMKKSNLLNKNSKKSFILFHSVSFPYVNVEFKEGY